MPTYQYACVDADCGNRFELVQSFTDPAADQCPVCEGPVRKVYSAVGVVFKGSGFYRTDSRNGSAKSEKSASSKSDSAPAKSSDSGSSSSSSKSSSDTSSSSSNGTAAKAAASA